MSGETRAGEALAAFMVSVLGGALIAFLAALALRDVWSMFVTPTWGLVAPGLPTAYGLAVLVSILTLRSHTADEEAQKRRTPSVLARAGGTVGGYSLAILLLWCLAASVHALWGYHRHARPRSR